MSFKIILVLLVLSGVVGIAAGYFLRWLVSLGQKGSAELAVKQILLEAREEAQNIVGEAEKKTAGLDDRFREEFKQKEDTLAEKDKRIGQKEGYLDQRQLDIDKEAERIKAQIEEVKKIKERADGLVIEREKELERVAGLSEDEAKGQLFETLERNHEEDMLVRIQKLEIDGKERLEAKARDILTTAIHRMGNSVHSDVMTTSVPIPSD